MCLNRLSEEQLRDVDGEALALRWAVQREPPFGDLADASVDSDVHPDFVETKAFGRIFRKC
jgi:hypothetical protein